MGISEPFHSSIFERNKALSADMLDLCKTGIAQFLEDPDSYDVRAVPDVMIQIAAREPSSAELRFHLYEPGARTYKHSCMFSFFAFCMHGRFKDVQWSTTSASDGSHYERFRHKGGELGPPKLTPGMLARALERHHYPGSMAKFSAGEVHSIEAETQDIPPSVMVIRDRRFRDPNTRVLSETLEISEPTIRIRSADDREIESAAERLRRILYTSLFTKD